MLFRPDNNRRLGHFLGFVNKLIPCNDIEVIVIVLNLWKQMWHIIDVYRPLKYNNLLCRLYIRHNCSIQ